MFDWFRGLCCTRKKKVGRLPVSVPGANDIAARMAANINHQNFTRTYQRVRNKLQLKVLRKVPRRQ